MKPVQTQKRIIKERRKLAFYFKKEVEDEQLAYRYFKELDKDKELQAINLIVKQFGKVY